MSCEVSNHCARRPSSHIIGDKGINVLKQLIPESWVVREYSSDYGIDMEVELFSDETQCTLGEHVLFQVKAVRGVTKRVLTFGGLKNVEKYSESTNESYSVEVVQYCLDTKLLATVETMGGAVVILLAVVDVDSNKAYLVCLNDYVEKVVVPQKSDYTKQGHIIVNIPVTNCLDAKGGREIIEWYGKRAKLFAFFNKVNYQSSEIERANPRDKCRLTSHFLEILERLDVWSASRYWAVLDTYQKELSRIKTQTKKLADAKIVNETSEGITFAVGEPDTENHYEVLFRPNMIDLFWRRLNGISHVFEEIGKEYFLPTEFYVGGSK